MKNAGSTANRKWSTNLQLASFGDDMANNTTRLLHCHLGVHVLGEESLKVDNASIL